MILFLGAHPDDESLGCGGYLASSKFEKVGFCFTAQSAFKSILPEMINAWHILGLKYLPDWNQAFDHRNLNRQSILDTLIKLRNEFKPSIVLTHSSFDCHPDHKVIHEETIRAFKHSTILGYSLPWNDVKGSDYRHFKKLDIVHVKQKLAALSEYKSQENRTYFDSEYQKALMMINGQQANTFFAEKFEIIRWIE